MSETPQLGERVRALADELREHVEGGRVAEAGEVADTLLGLDDEALRAGDPAVVKELLDAGSALIPAGDLARAEELYVKGLEALALSPNATEVDLVVPLHNLFALYDQAGKPAARDYAAATLGGLAERLDEPLPTKVVAVFQQFGEMFAAQGNAVASTVFFRQVQRALSAAGNLAEAALESEAEAAEARLAASPGPKRSRSRPRRSRTWACCDWGTDAPRRRSHRFAAPRSCRRTRRGHDARARCPISRRRTSSQAISRRRAASTRAPSSCGSRRPDCRSGDWGGPVVDHDGVGLRPSPLDPLVDEADWTPTRSSDRNSPPSDNGRSKNGTRAGCPNPSPSSSASAARPRSASVESCCSPGCRTPNRSTCPTPAVARRAAIGASAPARAKRVGRTTPCDRGQTGR